MVQSVKKNKEKYKISEKNSIHAFECYLEVLLKTKFDKGQKLIILCIGTDYIVGDCLGPLIGYKLKLKHNQLTIYGDLNNTIQSINLVETMAIIKRKYSNPFIIAIDSVLCFDHSQIGTVSLSDSGILPGIAFDKSIPYVGNISITGTTNSKIPFEEFIRTTRMSLVMQLADFIEEGLSNTLRRLSLVC